MDNIKAKIHRVRLYCVRDLPDHKMGEHVSFMANLRNLTRKRTSHKRQIPGTGVGGGVHWEPGPK